MSAEMTDSQKRRHEELHRLKGNHVYPGLIDAELREFHHQHGCAWDQVHPLYNRNARLNDLAVVAEMVAGRWLPLDVRYGAAERGLRAVEASVGEWLNPPVAALRATTEGEQT